MTNICEKLIHKALADMLHSFNKEQVLTFAPKRNQLKMADRVSQLSNKGQWSSRSSPSSNPPGRSTQPSVPTDETSVPLLVRLKDLDMSHVFITVGLDTSLDALHAQVLEAFRQSDIVNTGIGIPASDGISALEIKWRDSNHPDRFPLSTIFTAVNIASLLFFLKHRGSRDVVEVITRNQELSGRYR